MIVQVVFAHTNTQWLVLIVVNGLVFTQSELSLTVTCCGLACNSLQTPKLASVPSLEH